MQNAAASTLNGTSRITALAMLIAFVIGNVGCPVSAPRPGRSARTTQPPAGTFGTNHSGEAMALHAPGGKSSHMVRGCRFAPARTQQVGSPASAGEGPAIVGLILCAHPRVPAARIGAPRSVVAEYLRPVPASGRQDPVHTLETPPPRRSAA
jgi:hypothetical protein